MSHPRQIKVPPPHYPPTKKHIFVHVQAYATPTRQLARTDYPKQRLLVPISYLQSALHVLPKADSSHLCVFHVGYLLIIFDPYSII